LSDKLFIEDLKRANPIEQVIGETPGWTTIIGHGRYLSTREHPSMRIDTQRQWFNRFSTTDEWGDVIRWLEIRNGWDFKTAVEFLCRRSGTAAPNWSAESSAERIAFKEREDVFDVAVSVFERELWNTPAALDYVRSRGWTDETIKSAKLGYSGDKTDRSRMVKEMSDAISLSGGDPRSVAGATIVGFSGDVKRWLHEHDLDEKSEWIEQGFVPSFVASDVLVYPHFQYGHCIYFSGRRIKPYFVDGKLVKSKNPSKILVGDKKLYFNWEVSPTSKQLIIVEGQADAVTIGQWGYPAVALGGVYLDDRLLKSLGVGDERKEIDYYLALDSDAPGAIAVSKVADLFGPMVRLITWKGIGGIDTFIDPVDGEEKEVKDANDLLRGMQS
jgi:DNA primase